MGTNLSPALQSIMETSQEEARCRSQLIEPSHLVLAIVRCPQSGAFSLIKQAVSPSFLEEDLLALVAGEPTRHGESGKRIPMSPTSKTVVEKAICDVMGRDMAWTSVDLLLGILREGSSDTAALLNEQGVTLELVESLAASGSDEFADREV